MNISPAWAITALSIIGVILNIYKNKWCFVIWTFTNGAWCIYDFYLGAYPQAALFAVYFVLAIWGLYKWGKE